VEVIQVHDLASLPNKEDCDWAHRRQVIVAADSLVQPQGNLSCESLLLIEFYRY
jgi:hypothetical protein